MEWVKVEQFAKGAIWFVAAVLASELILLGLPSAFQSIFENMRVGFLVVVLFFLLRWWGIGKGEGGSGNGDGDRGD